MTATYTFDVFSSLDVDGSSQGCQRHHFSESAQS